MMKILRKGILLFALFGLIHLIHAQKYTISGHVNDAENGEVLISANVYIKSTLQGTITNVYGFYSISLDAGEYKLACSYLGYNSNEIDINLNENKTINILLNPTSENIEEVVVTAKKQNENILSPNMGNLKLNSKIIKKIPVLMGEVDIIKSLNLMPGVQTTGEGSSSMSIRGGTRDQNLILLDEAVVYNASHLLGIFSVFNNDAIKNVDLYKGNIPAPYGGRLSSLIDIRMKDGNMKKLSGKGGIGLISSRLTLEAPIVKDKGSFIVSGRRTYLDAILKGLKTVNKNINDFPLHFYDLNLKANYKLNDKHRVYLSGYFGRDVFKLSIGDKLNSSFDWGNYTATLRWNYIINQKLFSNVTFITSNYDYHIFSKFKFGKDKKESSYTWDAYLKDYSAKLDFGYYINPNNTLKFGAISTYHDFQIGKVKGKLDTIKFNYKLPKVYCLEHAAYVSNDQKIGSKLILNYGLRFSALQNIGKATVYTFENYEVKDTLKYKSGDIFNTYTGLEPRLGLAFILSQKHSLKLGYNRTRQYLQVASNSVSGTPIDMWIPSSPNVKPQISDQVSMGYFRNFKENSIKASAEVYYKYMQNQIDFKEFSDPFSNPQIEGDMRFGKGKAYGLELMLQKPEGKLTGWVSYTLSRSERKIKGLMEKDWFLSPYDIPHNVSVVASYTLSERVSLSGNWVFQSGMPLNAPVARWEYDNLILPYFPGRNEDRLPNYHRLDVGIEIKTRKKPDKKYESSWTFSLYNAYNRKNANTIYFEQNEDNPVKTSAMRISIFPMIPSFSYNFKF